MVTTAPPERCLNVNRPPAPHAAAARPRAATAPPTGEPRRNLTDSAVTGQKPSTARNGEHGDAAARMREVVRQARQGRTRAVMARRQATVTAVAART